MLKQIKFNHLDQSNEGMSQTACRHCGWIEKRRNILSQRTVLRTGKTGLKLRVYMHALGDGDKWWEVFTGFISSTVFNTVKSVLSFILGYTKGHPVRSTKQLKCYNEWMNWLGTCVNMQVVQFTCYKLKPYHFDEQSFILRLLNNTIL